MQFTVTVKSDFFGVKIIQTVKNALVKTMEKAVGTQSKLKLITEA